MSAFETGGAATQSFKASDGVGSIEESAAAEAAAASPASSPTPSPLAGAVSAFGQQPPSPQQPTAVFGQQQQPASAFGQQPTEEGVPGASFAHRGALATTTSPTASVCHHTDYLTFTHPPQCN
jgi:hypothetical protein